MDQSSDTPEDIRHPARRRRTAPLGRAVPDQGFIEALARGLQVLRCFSPDHSCLGNQELARMTGLPKSTVSRITYTLTSLGYLRYIPDSGLYCPDAGVLALGYGALSAITTAQLAQPYMKELARTTGAAVALGQFDGESMIYVEAIHGSSALYLRLPVGYRLAMDSTMGRAYLAQLPVDQCEQLLRTLPGSLPSELAVKQARADYQATGCCFGLGDWQQGIYAAAIAFESLKGEGTFVLSCGGPASLFPEDTLRTQVAQAMRDIAHRLSL